MVIVSIYLDIRLAPAIKLMIFYYYYYRYQYIKMAEFHTFGEEGDNISQHVQGFYLIYFYLGYMSNIRWWPVYIHKYFLV